MHSHDKKNKTIHGGEINSLAVFLFYYIYESLFCLLSRLYNFFLRIGSNHEKMDFMTEISPRRTVWNKVFSRLGNRLFVIKNREGIQMAVRISFYDDVVALFGRIQEKNVWQLFINECKKGRTILDVGAHIGRYTLLASSRVGISGKVIACEPYPENFFILLKNLQLNKCKNVTAIEVALSLEDGFVRISAGTDSGLHSTVVHKNFGDAHDLNVRSRTMDSLLKELSVEKVDLCKIDVEGAELLVLKGAESSLKDKKILRFICEIHERCPNTRSEEPFSTARF